MVTILPPSSAGNGRRFTTQRLIDNSAIIRRMSDIGAEISTSQTKSDPAPIGQESIDFASSRSAGVAGAIRFLRIFQRKFSVNVLE